MPSSLPRSVPQSATLVRLDALSLGLAVGWTLLLATSLTVEWRGNRAQAQGFARAEAQASYEKDVLYRRWVSLQGGVYVPPTDSVQPNPYLAHLPERDIVTTEGRKLTLVNPAYMTRMVHEIGRAQYGVHGHITSLKPLRPENAADEWEAAALRAIDQGSREVSEVVTYKGEPYLRYMRPFVTEASCLRCHAAQGYREGEIRGGISTSVPLTPYLAIAAKRDRADLLFHSLLFLVGLTAIGLGRRHLGHAIRTRENAHAALAENERRTRQMLERLPLVTTTCNLEGTIAAANEALLHRIGRTLPETVGRSFFEILVPREERAATEASFVRLRQERTATVQSSGHLLARDGSLRTISWLHVLITDERGDPVGVTSLGEDITVRAAEDFRLGMLSRAIDQSPLAVAITDAKGTIEYVNARFTEVTGYTAAEALGQNPRILSCGDNPPELYREMWATLTAGRDWHGTFHNRRKNGEHFWEAAHISPVRDASGAIVRYIAQKEDITARLQTERALAESEQRFRSLIENAPVAVIVHNFNRCLYANVTALRLFGYDESTDPTGLDIRNHIQPGTLPVVLERQQRAAAGLPNPPIELELRRCDGTTLACESIAASLTFNGQPALLALIVDVSERRLMLAALEESEARYRSLVEVAPVAVFSLAHGRFTYANPATARLLGFPSTNELIGGSIWSHVHADSLSAVTGLLGDGPAQPEPRPITELKFLRQDRAAITCAVVAVPITFGQQVAMLFIAADITERKKLENALRENEARMRETLESTNAGYFLLDAKDRLAHANSAFLEFFGHPGLGAVRGRPLPEIVPPAARAATEEFLQRLVCGEEFVGGELRFPRADGSPAYFSYTAHLVRAAGQLAGCEGFLLDTTAARSSEERYQMLFEQMLDAFALHEIVRDAAGTAIDYRYIAVNPAFERLVGRPASALLGRRVREVFPSIEEKWIARYGEVAIEGEPLSIEDYSSETDRYVEISAFRSSPGHFVTLVRDITERRQLEQQLQQAQKMEAVGQLAGGVAHDYNNILVAILMNLSMLRSENNLRPEVAESLRELEFEAKRAATLTRQLLVFSRRQAMQPAMLDFNEQLENMLKMLRRLLGEHIVIATELVPDLPPLLADPGMLDQVIMNLCVNARDAMPGGGRLTLRTARAVFAGPTHEHPEAQSGEFLRFTVRDTGAGMNEATRAHIFEPFFTTKEAGKGTGLGLATVFGIVKQHAGWIEVESAPGRGSSFHIHLPLANASTAPERPAAAAASPAANGTETILLVEDDQVARQTMSLTLRRDGYKVLEAADVDEALRLWSDHRDGISALITDVVMPGGRNGFELAQIVHRDKPDLGIVVISGYSDDAARTTPPVAGATYLAKPFDYETLTTALRACLARRR